MSATPHPFHLDCTRSRKRTVKTHAKRRWIMKQHTIISRKKQILKIFENGVDKIEQMCYNRVSQGKMQLELKEIRSFHLGPWVNAVTSPKLVMGAFQASLPSTAPRFDKTVRFPIKAAR